MKFFSKIKSGIRKKYDNKCANQEYSGLYMDLAPEENVSNADEYFKELNWALNNKNVNNIALTGPYGAGKSSILKSFFAKFHYNPISISIALFEDGKTKHEYDDENDESLLGGENGTERIARGFLQQLFYKVNYKKIPQSRYRKLHKISKWSIFLCLLACTVVVLTLICIVDNNTAINIFERLTGWGNFLGFNYIISGIVSIAIYFLILFGLSCIIKWAWTHIGNAEINIANTAKISKKTATQESIFDKYLDEIVYFFEENEYDVVVLEDIDRFDNVEIFVKLRELNRLLNNYESIRQHITFVYALRDDFFETSTERTKFFEYIISVIPYINSTNSDNLIRRRIEALRKTKMKVDVSDDYITQVAPFIADMRVLTSIFNDFVLYKNMLYEDKELELSDEQMLSIMIYKNLNPREFSQDESNQGPIKRAFEEKRSCIESKTTELQNELSDLKEMLDSALNDSLNSVEELKASLFFLLSHKTGTISKIRVNGKTFSFSEIMSDGFDIESLCNSPLTITSMMSNGNTNQYNLANISEIGIDEEELITRWKALRLKDNDKINSIKKNIEELNSEIHGIKALKIKEIISKYGTDKWLSETDKLLVFFLRNGYIDETYENYINYFHPDSITIEELRFILNVRNYDGLQDFEKPIIHKQRVVDRLLVHEFRQMEVLNYSLVEYLLSSKKNQEKQKELLRLLSIRTDEVKEFVRDYIQKYDKASNSFIAKLARENVYLWADLMNDSSMADDVKIHIFDLVMCYADNASIIAMNKEADRCIAAFIENTSDIFSAIKCTSVDKMTEILSLIDFKISSIDSAKVDDKICELIFKQSKYKICDEVFLQFVRLKNNNLIDKYKHAKHSTLLEINEESVLEYIYDNFDEYMESVYYLEENTHETVPAIIDLCKKYDFDLRAEAVVDFQNAIIDDISIVLDTSDDKEARKAFIEHVFDKGKCLYNWNNIDIYYKNYGLTDFIFEIIQSNINTLAKQPDSLADSFIADLLKKVWSEDGLGIFVQRYKMDDFSVDLKSIPDNNIRIMLEKNWITFDLDIYQDLVDVYPEGLFKYILNNQRSFFESIKDISVDDIPVDDIMREQKIETEKKIALIYCVPESEISREMAVIIRNADILIKKNYVLMAWKLLDKDEKYQLLLNQIDVLDNDDLPSLFVELDYMYEGLSLRNKRHKVSLYRTEYNKELLRKLCDKGYVSSTGMEEKTVTVYKPELNKIKEPRVYAWVRKV